MTARVNAFKISGLLLVSIALLFAYFFVMGNLPIAYLTKEFGIPSAVGSTLTWYLGMGATVSVIIGILSGFLTGGLGLIANAGRQALTLYLKEELRKRGKKAFIAW